MKPKSILIVVGARPNFIKAAPLCKALSRYPGVLCKIVHTGQHYDRLLSDIFFEELHIPTPDFHLHVGSAPHGQQTGKMMAKLEALCLAHPFAALVVIGDVNSTLAGALVGAKLNIPVVHIEAGLRSFNRSMPEEINRIVTDHVSELLFAPTRRAMANLENEGLERRACFSGDVMYDMILEGLRVAQRRPSVLRRLHLNPKGYYLATLHRPYNVDDPGQLKEIMSGLSQVDGKVALSAHPHLRKNLLRFGVPMGKNIELLEPFGYIDFIMLEKNARKVITDSGGVQKESFFIQTPCVTLRPETEWEETVEAGANILVRRRTAEEIIGAVQAKGAPRYDQQPYGDGHASEIIIGTIQSRFFS